MKINHLSYYLWPYTRSIVIMPKKAFCKGGGYHRFNDWIVFKAAFNSLQSYHSDRSHYSCLSWILPELGWSSEVSCQEDSVRLESRSKDFQKRYSSCLGKSTHFTLISNRQFVMNSNWKPQERNFFSRVLVWPGTSGFDVRVFEMTLENICSSLNLTHENIRQSVMSITWT